MLWENLQRARQGRSGLIKGPIRFDSMAVRAHLGKAGTARPRNTVDTAGLVCDLAGKCRQNGLKPSINL